MLKGRGECRGQWVAGNGSFVKSEARTSRFPEAYLSPHPQHGKANNAYSTLD
jgi:hypothetical protein